MKDILKVKEIHYWRFSVTLNKKQEAKLYDRSPRGILHNLDKILTRLNKAKCFDIALDWNIVWFSIKAPFYGEARIKAEDLTVRMLRFLSK